MKLKDATIHSMAPDVIHAIRVDLDSVTVAWLAPARVAQARLTKVQAMALTDLITGYGGAVYRAVFLTAAVGAPPDTVQSVHVIGAALIWTYNNQAYYTPTGVDWDADSLDAWGGKRPTLRSTGGGQNAN